MSSGFVVDLTHPLADGMPVYPGDPRVDVTVRATVARDQYAVRALRIGTHTGTHVDAPAHVLAGAPTLDELPLDRFAGPAVVVDARDLPPRTAIGTDVLDDVRDRLAPGVVVLVATGWSRYWGQEAYDAHPYPSPALARAIVDAGVRTVGIDAWSVDPTPVAGPLRAHLTFATAGAVIAENLADLDPLLHAQAAGSAVEVWLYPLRVSDGDGAPVRAVARVFEAAVRGPASHLMRHGLGPG